MDGWIELKQPQIFKAFWVQDGDRVVRRVQLADYGPLGGSFRRAQKTARSFWGSDSSGSMNVAVSTVGVPRGF